ncbi:hypothetical protein K1719_031494 [Acacia pycnantha]|nr:hypothetical protein K1719_031494 [Acacia pycnantha]
MEISDAVIVGGALVLGAYALVFGFLRRLNDWFYAAGKRYLPPGDMGWPFLGSMPSCFFSSFRSNPNSFVSRLISQLIPQSHTLTFNQSTRQFVSHRCLEEGAEEFLLKPVKLSDVKRLTDFIMKGETKGKEKRLTKEGDLMIKVHLHLHCPYPSLIHHCLHLPCPPRDLDYKQILTRAFFVSILPLRSYSCPGASHVYTNH